MNLVQLFLEELDREAPRTRRALENLPRGKDDWKPHPKSMSLLTLAGLVANMSSWFSMIIDQNELDLNPPGGATRPHVPTMDELVDVHDKNVVKSLESLRKTTDDFLFKTNWRLLVSGAAVLDQPRHVVLRDTMGHWAHHRGQLTVYLRLTGQDVPSIYGPSADDQRFV